MAMPMIVPRHRAGEYETLSRQFSGVPGCQVILDRRVVQFEVIPWCRVIIDRRLADRRQEQRAWPNAERRRQERRTGRLDNSPHGIVIFLR
jgi:hypothetical protein